MNGEAFSIRDAAAFVAAIDQDLEATTAENVELVRKGRLRQEEADYVTGLIRDVRSDLVHAFGPLELGQSYERRDPAVSWQDKNRWIGGELDRREAEFPELVRKGRLAPPDAEQRIRVLRTLRRLYWRELFMWDPEPGPALDWLRATRELNRLMAADDEYPGGRSLYRQLVRKHAAAVELEEAEQGRLVA